MEFDLSAACSGSVYALQIGAKLLPMGIPMRWRSPGAWIPKSKISYGSLQLEQSKKGALVAGNHPTNKTPERVSAQPRFHQHNLHPSWITVAKPFHALSVPNNMISESQLVLIVPKPASGNLVVAALKEVERSNHLNERLAECFFRIAWRKLPVSNTGRCTQCPRQARSHGVIFISPITL